MSLAPIVVFAFDRPAHTARLLASLLRNPESRASLTYVFCDGARESRDLVAVQATRDVVRRAAIPHLEIVERSSNWGLAANIIDGVTAVCEQHGKVIVLEDDLVLSSTFLRFVNHALDRYEGEERVMHVSGFMYPVRLQAEDDAVFLPFISSWGWGTWARAWRSFDRRSTGHEVVLRERAVRRRFDLDGCYPFSRMLERQIANRNASWAIRWYLSVFRRGGLALFPTTSLVENHGYGTGGTHCRGPTPRHVRTTAVDREVRRLPPVGVDEEAFELVKRLLMEDSTLVARALRRARGYVSRATTLGRRRA